jgi:hypothetical protein
MNASGRRRLGGAAIDAGASVERPVERVPRDGAHSPKGLLVW